MSLQSITSQIASVDQNIHSLETQVSSLDTSIARKQNEANSILQKISREKNLKRIVDFNKDLSRKQDEIIRLDKTRSAKAKSLADKKKKRNELQIQLNKLSQKEREQSIKDHKQILSLQQQIAQQASQQESQFKHTMESNRAIEHARKYDVFISHASEDKDDFVRTFANVLREKGVTVWYDEFELQIGDSLRKKIDHGLRNCRYGIIVLSLHFFKKEWTQRELDGLFSREEGIILPIWHKISKDEVKFYSPMIAGLLALNTASFTIDELADKIADKVLNPRTDID